MPPIKRKISSVEKVVMVVLLLTSAVLIIAAVFGKHGLLTYVELNSRYQTMQGEVAHLKEDNLRLKAEIEALKKDPDAIERVAREELGMIKPGEVLYRIKKKDELAEAPTSTQGAAQQKNETQEREQKP